MHPQLALIVAQQHIADLRRAADHHRLVHTATSSHAVSAPRHAAAAAPRSCACKEMTPDLDDAQPGRLEPREDQAGDCK